MPQTSQFRDMAFAVTLDRITEGKALTLERNEYPSGRGLWDRVVR